MVRPNNYDYGATHVRNGNSEYMWWTAQYPPTNGNPLSTDLIGFQRWQNGVRVEGPTPVFGPGTSGFDRVYIADPSVIYGSFYNPRDGRTYRLAMYYTGTDTAANNGSNNRIGLAFSNNGRNWVRYGAVIFPFSFPTTAYGAGQPCTHSVNGGSNLVVFQHDSGAHPTQGFGSRVWSRRTSNGINFSDVTTVTMNGLGIPGSANCDFAWTSQGDAFVGTIPLPGMPGSRDSNAIRVADINRADLFQGRGTWIPRGDINQALNGSFINSSPAILRNFYGSYTITAPGVQVASSRGGNDPLSWDIYWTFHTP